MPKTGGFSADKIGICGGTDFYGTIEPIARKLYVYLTLYSSTATLWSGVIML